ncbi:hypothetical protein ACFRJ1_32065 [Streptomyces sp. NPDC056773]|uniref:hypothetical protein n=1 Tax=unclassified Streptomyces TaxID=2593676 RepID=UPI0036CD6D86
MIGKYLDQKSMKSTTRQFKSGRTQLAAKGPAARAYYHQTPMRGRWRRTRLLAGGALCLAAGLLLWLDDPSAALVVVAVILAVAGVATVIWALRAPAAAAVSALGASAIAAGHQISSEAIRIRAAGNMGKVTGNIGTVVTSADSTSAVAGVDSDGSASDSRGESD